MLKILLALLLYFTTALAQADKTTDYIKAELAKRHIPGAAVAVIRNHKVILQQGFGMANIEQNIPVTATTAYQLASTTKPFTAMAIMMLVEGGKVSLDEKAATYLSWLPQIYREVTVKQLLTHTSGVNRDLRRDNLDNFTEDEFRKRLAVAPPSFTPGEKWEYSNTGYIILGMIIEIVSNKPYGEFLTARIFTPIGMNDTRYYEPPGKTKNRAIGYEWQVDAYRATPYFPGGFAAGGLISTVSDMVKWEIALDEQKLLKRSSIEQMRTPAKLKSGEVVSFRSGGEQASYGFGWFLTSYRGHKVINHGGAISGFSSIINHFVDDKMTVIVLCNSKLGEDRIGQADALARGIADIYFHDPSRK
jgi:D-alanyl-D-alanine carboxypeptidase